MTTTALATLPAPELFNLDARWADKSMRFGDIYKFVALSRFFCGAPLRDVETVDLAGTNAAETEVWLNAIGHRAHAVAFATMGRKNLMLEGLVHGGLSPEIRFGVECVAYATFTGRDFVTHSQMANADRHDRVATIGRLFAATFILLDKEVPLGYQIPGSLWSTCV